MQLYFRKPQAPFLRLFLIIPALAMCHSVSAAPVTHRFTGQVTVVDDPHQLLDSSVAVGQPLSGYYTFDSEAKDTSAHPAVGDYWMKGKGDMAIRIGSVTFRADDKKCDLQVALVNDVDGDQFSVRSYMNQPIRPGLLVESLDLTLNDPTGAALESPALPVAPPEISHWLQADGPALTGREVPAHRDEEPRRFSIGIRLDGFLPGDAASEKVAGDVNGDGKLTLQDVQLALRIMIGARAFSRDAETVADINEDGRVDMRDIIQILRILVGRS